MIYKVSTNIRLQCTIIYLLQSATSAAGSG